MPYTIALSDGLWSPDNHHYKKEKTKRTMQVFTSFSSSEALALGILRCLAGALESVLLALFYSGISG